MEKKNVVGRSTTEVVTLTAVLDLMERYSAKSRSSFFHGSTTKLYVRRVPESRGELQSNRASTAYCSAPAGVHIKATRHDKHHHNRSLSAHQNHARRWATLGGSVCPPRS